VGSGTQGRRQLLDVVWGWKLLLDLRRALSLRAVGVGSLGTMGWRRAKACRVGVVGRLWDVRNVRSTCCFGAQCAPHIKLRAPRARVPF
jgi:hypothetical protein